MIFIIIGALSNNQSIYQVKCIKSLGKRERERERCTLSGLAWPGMWSHSLSLSLNQERAAKKNQFKINPIQASQRPAIFSFLFFLLFFLFLIQDHFLPSFLPPPYLVKDWYWNSFSLLLSPSPPHWMELDSLIDSLESIIFVTHTPNYMYLSSVAPWWAENGLFFLLPPILWVLIFRPSFLFLNQKKKEKKMMKSKEGRWKRDQFLISVQIFFLLLRRRRLLLSS